MAEPIIEIRNLVRKFGPRTVLNGVTFTVEKGDTLYLTESPDGEMRLSAYSPGVAEEIALGEAFMDEYRDTFRALAK